MSCREKCCGKACVESFIGILKGKLIHRRQYRELTETEQKIFEISRRLLRNQVSAKPGIVRWSRASRTRITVVL
ncbi:MAG: hypothetical protein P0121_16970 [Nitrospira sp.]|nr:hypothetical protein [Nitrospira sp.]